MQYLVRRTRSLRCLPDMPTNDDDIRRARALARALDSAVGVPGTPIRIGLDAVLGLIPGAGDIAGGVLSGYIVLTAVRAGAPSPVIWRMLANIGVDTLVGSVPVIGDVFDVAYKSNIKNVELLERYSAQPAAVTRRSEGMFALVIAALIIMISVAGFAAVFLVRLVWHLLSS